MKVFAINGSPRKNWNTAKLLENFLDGVKTVSEKIETETVNLYELNYKGCCECYACKLKNGKFNGKCAQRDDISDLLERLSEADVVVFGSPIFYGGMTGELRSFIERFLYPVTAFQKNSSRTIAKKKIRTAFIYTMNITEENAGKLGYSVLLAPLHGTFERTFGFRPEVLYSYFTYQFSDYSRYVSDFWDIEAKKEWREKQFPADCENAFLLGKKLAESLNDF